MFEGGFQEAAVGVKLPSTAHVLTAVSSFHPHSPPPLMKFAPPSKSHYHNCSQILKLPVFNCAAIKFQSWRSLQKDNFISELTYLLKTFRINTLIRKNNNNENNDNRVLRSQCQRRAEKKWFQLYLDPPSSQSSKAVKQIRPSKPPLALSPSLVPQINRARPHFFLR